jgi:hypothetical protein
MQAASLTNFKNIASARPSIIIWEYQLDVGTSLALLLENSLV